MNTTNTPETKRGPALKNLLATHGGGLLSHYWLWLVVVLAVIAVAGWLTLRSGEDKAAPRYTTEAATVGMLVVKVSAPATCSRPTRWMWAANCPASSTRCSSTTTTR